MFQGINVIYWFSSIKKKVKDHTDNCLVYLIVNAPSKHEGEMQFTPIPKNLKSCTLMILHQLIKDNYIYW